MEVVIEDQMIERREIYSMSQTAIITGSSRGIGRATARLFAEKGYQVMIHYHQAEQEALELFRQLTDQQCQVAICQADISDSRQVGKLIDKTMAAFGSVDVLVNNAGISQQKLFTDITEAEWDTMMNVHIKGMFHSCQAVLPHMIYKKSGKIINLSSIWGITGASCEVHYSTAKAAVIGFTKALAKELAPSNIHVNCVAPGIVDTDMNRFLSSEELQALREDIPLQRLGTVEEIANCVYFLASEQAGFITGQVISPNGGYVI